VSREGLSTQLTPTQLALLSADRAELRVNVVMTASMGRSNSGALSNTLAVQRRNSAARL